MSPRVLHIAQILWPAFIIAGVLEMVVFAWVDPSWLRIGNWQPEAQAAYTVAFFVFWALVSLSSVLSHWMIKASSAAAEHDTRRVRRHARRHMRSMA